MVSKLRIVILLLIAAVLLESLFITRVAHEDLTLENFLNIKNITLSIVFFIIAMGAVLITNSRDHDE